jgi:glycosyltransferase involved in cell wall biosynthesis
MINVNQPAYSNHPSSSMRARYPYVPQLSRPPITVSILTAFFNTDEVFLETAVSIFNQSFQEWEWIVVDDGSTDKNALDRLVKVGQMDPRIRILRQENRGPAAARNTAFKCSTGRYVCLLDSDDLIEPTFLEKTIWFLESQPDFAFCNSWSVTFGHYEYLLTSGFERGKAHIKGNSGPFHSVIKREAYAAAKGFDETIRFGHEDWDFWLALASAGYWGHTLSEYLEWYRRRDTGRHAQVLGSLETHRQFQKYIKKKYGDLEARFPNPRLKISKPFETVSSYIPFENRLEHEANHRKILFLIPWMITGGADRVNLDWVRGLLGQGYRVSVCATLSAQHNWLHEFTALTPDVFILPHFLHLSDFPRFLVYLIRSRGIDTVIVSNCTLGYQLLPYLRCACPGVSFVDLSHVEEPHWLNGGHPRFGVGYQDMLDMNIVTTKNLREWMKSRGADAEKIEVCYSGISSEATEKARMSRDPARVRLGVPDQMPLLIFGGRICAQKRPELLAAVLHELARQGVPFHCVVVGDGELRPMLKRRFRQYGLKRSVTMLGALLHEEWLDVLSAGDILFLPSQYEGISVALFEAMAMGVVPVISAVGGQPELVAPGCGVLIPLGDREIDEYVAALRRLIENPATRKAMSETSRQRIAQFFTLDHTIPSLTNILDRALKLSRATPRQSIPPGLARELATLAVEYARLTTGIPMPTQLAKALAFIRTYKIGRVILRMKLVRTVGQWVLGRIRDWRL